jgi:hypothetical protein
MWDSVRAQPDELVRRGDVEHDDASAIFLGTEAGAVGAGHDDVAEVAPAEVEEAPSLGLREPRAPSLDQR